MAGMMVELVRKAETGGDSTTKEGGEMERVRRREEVEGRRDAVGGKSEKGNGWQEDIEGMARDSDESVCRERTSWKQGRGTREEGTGRRRD